MKDEHWEVLPNEEPEQSRDVGSFSQRKGRFAVAFGVALVSDIVSVFTELLPPVQWAVDLATACLLYVLLGRQWLLLPGLIAEAIPGIAMFPFWVMVVASIAVWGRIHSPQKPSPK